MTTYKCWYDNQEAWDPGDIEPPALIEATSAYEAACKFASQDWRCEDDTDVAVIVQDEYEQYIAIDVRRSWNVTRSHFTTLAELCDEEGEAPL